MLKLSNGQIVAIAILSAVIAVQFAVIKVAEGYAKNRKKRLKSNSMRNARKTSKEPLPDCSATSNRIAEEW